MEIFILISSNTRWVFARKNDIEQACRKAWISTGRECNADLKAEDVDGLMFIQHSSATDAPLSLMGVHCYLNKRPAHFTRRLNVNIASEVSEALSVMYQQVAVFMHETSREYRFTNPTLVAEEETEDDSDKTKGQFENLSEPGSRW